MITHVSILITLFTAIQNPNHKNCGLLRDSLVKQASEDAMDSRQEVHADEDLQAIKVFVSTKCKDGIKRKLNK